MQIKKLINPYLFIYLFILQIFFWIFFMPTKYNIGELNKYGIATKYFTSKSIILFVLLTIYLVYVLYFTSKININFTGKKLEHYFKYSEFLFIIWIIVVILSLLFFLKNPIGYIQMLISGFSGEALSLKRDSKNILGTLVNLHILLSSIYSRCIFMNVEKNKSIKRLLCIFIFLLIYALFLFERMQIFYFLIIVLFSYSLVNLNKKIDIRKFFLLILASFIFLITAEMFRFGSVYAFQHNKRLFSLEVVTIVSKYLATAYFASDFNNTMVILSDRPAYVFLSTGSPMIASLFYKFTGIKEKSYNQVEHWESGHGTVNIMGYWWFDFGWFIILVILILGLFIGIVFSTSIKYNKKNNICTIIFPIVAMNTLLFFRLNMFFETMFLIPLIFVIFFEIFYSIVKRRLK